MNSFKYILNYFGLFLDDETPMPYSYKVDEYKNKNKESLEVHKQFLNSIIDEENNRLNLIENKTSQLVSQTGVIFSLLSLFIPIFIDKINDVSIILRIVFILLLILAFTFYLLTINNAIKNFNVKNFIYSKPSPLNVLNHQEKTVTDFMHIEIKDLLYSINTNLKTNNTKATNLIHSYNSFKIANFITAILVTLICFSLLFIGKKEIDSQKVETINNIKNEKPYRNNVKISADKKGLNSENLLIKEPLDTLRVENKKTH